MESRREKGMKILPCCQSDAIKHIRGTVMLTKLNPQEAAEPLALVLKAIFRQSLN